MILVPFESRQTMICRCAWYTLIQNVNICALSAFCCRSINRSLDKWRLNLWLREALVVFGTHPGSYPDQWRADFERNGSAKRFIRYSCGTTPVFWWRGHSSRRRMIMLAATVKHWLHIPIMTGKETLSIDAFRSTHTPRTFITTKIIVKSTAFPIFFWMFLSIFRFTATAVLNVHEKTRDGYFGFYCHLCFGTTATEWNRRANVAFLAAFLAVDYHRHHP